MLLSYLRIKLLAFLFVCLLVVELVGGRQDIRRKEKRRKDLDVERACAVKAGRTPPLGSLLTPVSESSHPSTSLLSFGQIVLFSPDLNHEQEDGGPIHYSSIVDASRF